ncbi:ligase-associated DNA damage response exonuclease [Nevskia sp.]|uniref:ligase-associated DNA damage response exonuclease n=1 Tax=Nevskia sp. TaxID=1929292 RepID=UPI0025F0BA81|nr:ligase-associated DNA damage response exonuclease [Nevskia sp.]
MRENDLVIVRPEGLYCPHGDFHIDPWRGVPKAVITHAHADHARSGSAHYWGAARGLGLLRERLGRQAAITPLAYGERLRFNDVTVSLHSAGHVLGSAQVRIEHDDGRVWGVSGDFKRDPDPSCDPFEPFRCDTWITEATFALPIYRWTDTRDTAVEILDWWQACKRDGQTAVLFCYSLGKAQRLLAELAQLTDERVFVHGAMPGLIKVYRDAGIRMLPTETIANIKKGTPFAGELVLAPPGAGGTPWMKRFHPYSTGFASGWMRVRGGKRRAAYDRGFVLSDHADWDSLLRTIDDTGARRVLVTHGHGDALIEHLTARGIEASMLATKFEGEGGAATDAEVPDAAESPDAAVAEADAGGTGSE